MGLVQLRKGFQLTVPAAVRRKLGLKEGDFVSAEVEGKAIILRPRWQRFDFTHSRRA
jgi:AbrB family looped-hinge helix DNA binding protein